MNLSTTISRALGSALLLASIAGCGLMKKDEAVSAVVDRRAVGMTAGEFFDRFGRAGPRREQNDGSSEYEWVSAVPYARPGPAPEGLNEHICKLKLTVDPKGRISTAQILFDAIGLKSTSRCAEIFSAA